MYNIFFSMSTSVSMKYKVQNDVSELPLSYIPRLFVGLVTTLSLTIVSSSQNSSSTSTAASISLELLSLFQ